MHIDGSNYGDRYVVEVKTSGQRNLRICTVMCKKYKYGYVFDKLIMVTYPDLEQILK